MVERRRQRQRHPPQVIIHYCAGCSALHQPVCEGWGDEAESHQESGGGRLLPWRSDAGCSRTPPSARALSKYGAEFLSFITGSIRCQRGFPKSGLGGVLQWSTPWHARTHMHTNTRMHARTNMRKYSFVSGAHSPLGAEGVESEKNSRVRTKTGSERAEFTCAKRCDSM